MEILGSSTGPNSSIKEDTEEAFVYVGIEYHVTDDTSRIQNDTK